MLDILEIKDTCIIVVLAREDGVVQVARMSIAGDGQKITLTFEEYIRDRMLVGIPSAKARVQPSHESNHTIN